MVSSPLQVNCLRDSVAMNIRFESRGVEKRGRVDVEGEKKDEEWGESADPVLSAVIPLYLLSFLPRVFPTSLRGLTFLLFLPP